MPTATNATNITKKNSFLRNKKLKYGGTAVLLTAVVVAVVVLVNVIFTSLCSAYLWYIDMTTEQLYGITDASREHLAGLTKEDVDIKIIFCTSKDMLEQEYYQKLVHQCALAYEKEFDFVTVEYVDIITNPTAINRYKTTAATNIKTTNVIIENGAAFRVFALDGFYTMAESTGLPFAFNGEKKITETILQMTGDNPIAYFTIGHGETTTSSKLAELFEGAGYEVRTIDLTQEEIDPNAQVVIINGPHYDFAGVYDEVDELNKIADFLDDLGNLIIFMDPNSMGTRDFPNLTEFLSEWGISYNQSLLKDSRNSISVDGTSLVAVYPEEGSGASLHTSLRSLETTPKSIVRYTMPIDILWEANTIDQSSRYVTPVLLSSTDAEAYDFADQDTVSATGPFNLLVLSQDVRYIDNEPHFSYVLAGGTSEFAAQEYLESNAYGNSEILYATMLAMGKKVVPTGMDFRVFEDNSLDITAAQANTWTIVLTAVIPSVVLVCGLVVWIRRRHL